MRSQYEVSESIEERIAERAEQIAREDHITIDEAMPYARREIERAMVNY